jgi:hypothetical protein
LQAPQCCTLVWVFTSQPSEALVLQSLNGALQVKLQLPSRQVRVALGRSGQGGMAHPLQWSTSVRMLISQPSAGMFVLQSA